MCIAREGVFARLETPDLCEYWCKSKQKLSFPLFLQRDNTKRPARFKNLFTLKYKNPNVKLWNPKKWFEYKVFLSGRNN